MLVKAVSDDWNCRLPLEEALTVVNVWPYSWNGNGIVMGLLQSSQLEPGTRVVACTTIAPVEEVII